MLAYCNRIWDQTENVFIICYLVQLPMIYELEGLYKII
jgi:hypothetical protein